MSVLTYDDIPIQLLKTEIFEWEPDFEPAKVDVKWGQYRVRVSGLVSTLAGTIPATNAYLANWNTLKHRLEQPRRALTFTVGNQTILSVSGLDAGLGPVPDGPAQVVQMGEGVFFVRVGYIVRMVDCANNNQNPVVSLRWEQSESYDENWYTTIRTSGLLCVRSDLRQAADSFRDLCTPNILPDFERQTAEYTLSNSGTELSFTTVDKEKYLLAPRPATKASGQISVNTVKGSLRYGQCDVHLEGPKGVDRKGLMAVAIRLAFSQLELEGLQRGRIVNGRFSAKLFENVVDVSLQAQLTNLARPAKAANPKGILDAIVGGVGGVVFAGGGGVTAPDPTSPGPINSAGITAFTGSNADGLAPPIRRRLIGLIAASFRDPCAAAANFTEGELRTTAAGLRPNSGILKAGGNALGAIGKFILSVGSVLPSSSTSAISDPVGYEHYRVVSEYSHDSGMRQIPGTGVGSDGKKSSFVSVHGGMMKLFVAWTASRTGTPPVLPSKDSGDSNIVYLDSVIMPTEVQIAADGYSPVYEVTGCYTYGIKDPDKVSITAPVPPFMSNEVKQAGILVAAHYSKSILWGFKGQQGPNPQNKAEAEKTPDSNLTDNLGGNLKFPNGTGFENGGLVSSGEIGGIIPTNRVNP
jgi:hypothetical protein